MAKATPAKRQAHPNAPAVQSRETGNAVALTQDFRRELGTMESQFAPMLPPHIPADRFARVVMNAVNREPKLLAVDRRSLWNACMQSAEDGLLPDRREGAIVPFKNRKTGNLEAVWIPMVGGIRKLVRNSGLLTDLKAEVVYARDTFDYQLGDEPRIYHKPQPGPRDSQSVIYAYSIATFPDAHLSREVMPIEQILQVARKSPAFEAGPWSDPVFFQEMAKKTVTKLHAKQLPTARDLDRVMRRDDALYQFEEAAKRQNERPTIAGGTRAALDHFAGAGPQAASRTVAPEQQSLGGPSNEQGSPQSGYTSDGSDTPAAGEERTGEAAATREIDLPPEWPADRKPANPDEYAVYFRSWLAREPDAGKAKARFKAEQDMRLDFADPKMPAELTAALKIELENRYKAKE